jgi:hypothetical protein
MRRPYHGDGLPAGRGVALPVSSGRQPLSLVAVCRTRGTPRGSPAEAGGVNHSQIRSARPRTGTTELVLVSDARRLMLSFRTILRVGKVTTLHRWLARAHATNIPALHRFVRTLRRDLPAVEGAVREAWSNGPVEGHQSPENAAAADVRARRCRTLAHSPVARAVGEPLATTIVLSLKSVGNRTTWAFDHRCHHAEIAGKC